MTVLQSGTIVLLAFSVLPL